MIYVVKIPLLTISASPNEKNFLEVQGSSNFWRRYFRIGESVVEIFFRMIGFIMLLKRGSI